MNKLRKKPRNEKMYEAILSLKDVDECMRFFDDLCTVSELLAMEQSAISHQLKILKNAKLVKCRREGKTNIYSLADDHVRHIIGQGFEHLTEENEK